MKIIDKWLMNTTLTCKLILLLARVLGRTVGNDAMSIRYR